MSSLTPDVRFALRAIRRSPLFASVAIQIGGGPPTPFFCLTKAGLVRIVLYEQPHAGRPLRPARDSPQSPVRLGGDSDRRGSAHAVFLPYESRSRSYSSV